MSDIQGRTYDDAATVTPSDTVADPAGPFAGLLVGAAGTLKITTIVGTTVSIAVIAGQEVHIATQRVWTGGPSVIGLKAVPYNTRRWT